MKTVIIDYGSGNLKSAYKAFERALNDHNIKGQILVSDKAHDIKTADRLILPGVGAFKDCYDGLKARDGLLDALTECVQTHKRPFMGICVGMQLLATNGLEHQGSKGLNWLKGEVRAVELHDKALKIPHMGWNNLQYSQANQSHDILKNIDIGQNGLHAYFVHSYQFHTKNPDETILTTQYGEKITAMVAKDNIVGTQFHPEKSQKLGLQLIANFLNWQP